MLGKTSGFMDDVSLITSFPANLYQEYGGEIV